MGQTTIESKLVAHRLPGVGQVGAGVLAAPLEPFRQAYEAVALAL